MAVAVKPYHVARFHFAKIADTACNRSLVSTVGRHQ